MKKLILIATLLFGTCAAFSQKILFSEDFNSFPSYTITGWTHKFSGAVPWQVGLPYQIAGAMGGPMLVNKGNNLIAGIGDSSTRIGMLIKNDSVFMYSPAINLAGVTNAWLSYDSYFLKYSFSSYQEVGTVEVSINNGTTWTVLQNVPASPVSAFATYNLDLSAYNNQSNVRIGFRYKDGGRGNMRGWAIDNIKMFIPAHKDLEMLPAEQDPLLTYVVLNETYIHHGTVKNNGLDTVHSFVVKYRGESGFIFADTINGVTIPSFATYNFTYSVPDTVIKTDATKIMMWAELAGDTIHANDSTYTTLRGSYFAPHKKQLIEEGTGTHYYWGPRGWVYMNQVAVPSDSLDVCVVSVHDGDPMTDPDYNTYMLNCNYYPEYFLLDRKWDVAYDKLFATLQQKKHDFAFASIELDGSLNGTSLSVNAHLTPAVDMTGDYRLMLIVTEDHVTGTTSAYDQYNNFSGGAYGPMGGFESKPNPVPAADMYYNFVARQIYPTPEGKPGMLPATMIHNNIYSYSFNTLIDASWNINKLRAIVVLLNNGDSTILNCNRLSGYLKVDEPSVALINATIYPNPARDYTAVQFYMNTEENVILSISDIAGRPILVNAPVKAATGRNEIKVPLAQLSNGIYMVTLTAGSLRQTLKLEVMR